MTTPDIANGQRTAPPNIFQESLAALANAIATIGVLGEHAKQAGRTAADDPGRSEIHMKAAVAQAKQAMNYLAVTHGALATFVEEQKPRIVSTKG